VSTGKFITRNLSLARVGNWKSGCSTTLIVTDAAGTNMPVLGRTLNFSGDVVLIWNILNQYCITNSTMMKHEKEASAGDMNS
jgi:hypothetical protein